MCCGRISVTKKHWGLIPSTSGHVIVHFTVLGSALSCLHLNESNICRSASFFCSNFLSSFETWDNLLWINVKVMLSDENNIGFNDERHLQVLTCSMCVNYNWESQQVLFFFHDTIMPQMALITSINQAAHNSQAFRQIMTIVHHDVISRAGLVGDWEMPACFIHTVPPW